MGDFEEKLESILNNPQAMNQILSLAQSLGTSEPPQETASSSTADSTALSGNFFTLDPNMIGHLTSLLGKCNQSEDQRIALLNALRPFLKEQRHAKIDKAIQIAKLSRVARVALDLFRTKEAELNV